DERTARREQAVGRAREPPRVIAATQLPLGGRLQLDTRPRVLDVLPTDLIGEPQFVVTGRIELIEGAARPVLPIGIPRGVVEFAEAAQVAGDLDERSANDRVSGPRTYLVGPDRACLNDSFTRVVERRGKLAGHPNSRGGLVQRGEPTELRRHVLGLAP